MGGVWEGISLFGLCVRITFFSLFEPLDQALLQQAVHVHLGNGRMAFML